MTLARARSRTLDVAALGRRVLVIAPHPDDEAIGCGGLIALLCERGVQVGLLLLSDGEMSHPGSKLWPPLRRAALRRSEFADSLAILGVQGGAARRLGWPDGAPPEPGTAAHVAAVATLARHLQAERCDTVVAPWRRDPHADHRAAYALLLAAKANLQQALRVLEYVVWAPERSTADDLPTPDELTCWTLDISQVVPAKLRAVAAHRSQCGGVIDDDPTGFTLPASMLLRCAEPVEIFYESTASAPIHQQEHA